MVTLSTFGKHCETSHTQILAKLPSRGFFNGSPYFFKVMADTVPSCRQAVIIVTTPPGDGVVGL